MFELRDDAAELDFEPPVEVGVAVGGELDVAGVVVAAVGLSVLLEASFTGVVAADVAGVTAGTGVSVNEKLLERRRRRRRGQRAPERLRSYR